MSFYTENNINYYYYGAPDAPTGPRNGAQVYSQIVKSARASGKKFEDPNFPADESSLGVSGINNPIQWVRAPEIARILLKQAAPQFGVFDEFAVDQGSVGNCWFLATLADVAVKPDIINNLVPADNRTNGFDSGAFHFRFWNRGKWVDVVVSDELPCVVGPDGTITGTLFAKPTVEKGFWAPLLEKAYAKLYGQYNSINEGWAKVAMLDFTGGLTNSWYAKDAKTKDIARDVLKAGGLVACGTKSQSSVDPSLLRPHDPRNPGQEGVTTNGMVLGHEYSILDMQDVVDKEDPSAVYTLIKMRNPWGNETEWKGNFSDTDPNNVWSTVDRDLRRTSADAKKDGEFWIQWEDMVTVSETIYTCYWSKDFRGDKTESKDGRIHFITQGTFTAENCGKVPNMGAYVGKKGWIGHLKAVDPNNQGEYDAKFKANANVSFHLTLIYNNYKIAGSDPAIPDYGIKIYWVPGNVELNQPFLMTCKMVTGDWVSKDHQWVKEFKIPEGTVMIIPWIQNPSTAGQPYTLRIVTEGDIQPATVTDDEPKPQDGGEEY